MGTIGKTLRKSLVIAILFGCIAPGAKAQHVLMRGTDLLPVADCPIEKPCSPEPDRSRSTFDQESPFFAMDGYLYYRTEFSGLNTATDLEIMDTREPRLSASVACCRDRALDREDRTSFGRRARPALLLFPRKTCLVISKSGQKSLTPD